MTLCVVATLLRHTSDDAVGLEALGVDLAGTLYHELQPWKPCATSHKR